MASSFCKIMLTAVTLAASLVILKVDAQHFTYPIKGTKITRNGLMSGIVDFLFSYTVPHENQMLSITCGYEVGEHIAQKIRTQPARIHRNSARKAEVVKDDNGKILTIRFKNLQLKDERIVFQCVLAYSGLVYYSGKYFLKVHVRPEFRSCLRSGIVKIESRNEFTLNEGETLSTTCIVYGRPVPFLQCSLLNKDGLVDNGATTSRERRNYSLPITKRLRFHNVQKTATKIRCVADGGPVAGKKTEEKYVVVGDYSPRAPEKIEVIKITKTSIKFRWTAPNDKGSSKIIRYWLTIIHPNSTRSARKYLIPTPNPLLEYTLSYLQSGASYRIEVSAVNSFGQGKVRTATFKTISLKGPGTGTGISILMIIGIGAGGFVFIVIIISIACCVAKKKRRAARKRKGNVERARHNRRSRKAKHSKEKKKPVDDPYETAMYSKARTEPVDNPYDDTAMYSKVRQVDNPHGEREHKKTNKPMDKPPREKSRHDKPPREKSRHDKPPREKSRHDKPPREKSRRDKRKR